MRGDGGGLLSVNFKFKPPNIFSGSLGMVGLLLQAISKDLSVIELMGIFQGEQKATATLCTYIPHVYNYIYARSRNTLHILVN